MTPVSHSQLQSFSAFKSVPPVPPLPTLKDTHHRSEFHGERVCFFKVGMSAILKKRVLFWPKYSHFLPKGVYFLHIEQTPPHFVEKGSLLSSQKLFPLSESQRFVE